MFANGLQSVGYALGKSRSRFGFDVEAQGHQIVSVLVSEGPFPWGHRIVALLISCVDSFDARVELNVTVAEAARLASRPEAMGSET